MNNLVIEPFKLLLTDRAIPFDIIFFSLLLIAIPIVLITGPALPDIFLSLIAFYFLLKSVLNKNWKYYKNILVIGFLFFSLYGILRSLLSDLQLESLTNEGSIFYFRYIFFAMGVWYLLDNNPYLSKCLLITSVTCLIIVCVDGLYQYFVGLNLFGNEKHSPNRLTGFFGKEPILGRYIAYLSIFTFTLIYHNFKKTKRLMIVSVLFLVLCEVIVFLTGERVPFFYMSFFTFLILIFIPKYRVYRIIGILTSIVIIAGIVSINPTAKTRMIDKTINQISQTNLPFLPYAESYEKHYISAIKMFTDNPIFGIGTNTYRFQCDKLQYNFESNCNSHPHNFYIQVLAELGIVGFIFLAIFFLYLFSIGFRQLVFMILSDKKKQLSFEHFLYAMVLFVYWWPIIPHMSLYNNWNNALMMLPLGFFMKYFYGNKMYGNFNKT